MSIIYNKKDFGLIKNGDFTYSNSSYNFTNFIGPKASFTGQVIPTGGFNNKPYLQIVGGNGDLIQSNDFIPIDTSKSYQMIAYARTIQRASFNNSLAGGHIGLVCYDIDRNSILPQTQGGIGNTVLSRDLNVGDQYIYIQSISGWSTGADEFRYCLIYPATHPLYSVPYRYTRIGYGSFNIRYTTGIVQMPEGDYRLTITNTANTPITFPNIGYPTPSGTPVCNGQTGGTFNYVLGAPDYPEIWTRYASAPFSGETRGSSTPLRFGTRFVKFMLLINYNQRTTLPRDHIWGLSNIFLSQCVGSRDYRSIL